MQVNSTGFSRFNIVQNREISQNKLEDISKNFDKKSFISEAMALNNKEVVPKDLISSLTQKHGANFFDGIGKNSNNQITFADLDSHLAKNLKDFKGPKIMADIMEFKDFDAGIKLQERLAKSETISKEDLEDIKKIFGANTLDGFKPKDSENITFKELDDFMGGSDVKPEASPNMASGFFKSDKILSNEQIQSKMINQLQKLEGFKELKREDFMFESAYNRVDMSKIFMDVVL